MSEERVVARTAEALVVSGRRGVVACLRDGGRRYRLDNPSEEDELNVLERVLLSGKFVLYEVQTGSIGAGGPNAGMLLTDLRTGKEIAGVAFGDAGNFPTTVRGWVMKRNGSFAFIQDREQRGTDIPPERTLQFCPVRTCTHGEFDPSEPTIVAAGFDIKASSLSLRRSRVCWIEAGERRCARL